MMNSDKQNQARELQMREAALAYERFLNSNPEERAAMEDWETAPRVDAIEPAGF
jgi:hypothetical protein